MISVLNILDEFEFVLLARMINGDHDDEQCVTIYNKLKDF